MRARQTKWLAVVAIAAFASLTFVAPADGAVARGNTIPIDVLSDGTPMWEAFGASLSSDGRFVAFWGRATQTASLAVYVLDRTTGTLDLAYQSAVGPHTDDNDNHVTGPDISADGQTLVFSTDVNTVDPTQTCTISGTPCQYVYATDRSTDTTSWLSHPYNGPLVFGTSTNPTISDDGEKVVYESNVRDLLPTCCGNTNVVMANLSTGETSIVSKYPDGREAQQGGRGPTISADGSTAVFTSNDRFLDPTLPRGNGAEHAFAADLATGAIRQVLPYNAFGDLSDDSVASALSGDGRFVTFVSNDVVIDDGIQAQLYLVDRTTGVVEHADLASDNDTDILGARWSKLSADGRYVVIGGQRVGSPGGVVANVVVHDRATDSWTIVDVDSNGNGFGNRFSNLLGSEKPDISADGRFVTFVNRMLYGDQESNPGWDHVGLNDLRPPSSAVTDSLNAGDTLTTDTDGDGATYLDPVEAAVTTPGAASVTIAKAPSSAGPPDGYLLVGSEFDITATPSATAANPFVFSFRIDASAVPSGATAANLTLTRNATPIAACTATAGTASPDPCLDSAVTLPDGDIQLTVLTSHASVWQIVKAPAVPPPTDTTPPDITIGTPGVASTYQLGQAVNANYGCTDTESEVSACDGPVASGQLLDTSTVGVQTFTVHAVDAAGNDTTAQRQYTVDYAYTGFFQPVDNPAKYNVMPAGRSLPVKFALNGNHGLAVISSVTSAQMSCTLQGKRDTVETTFATTRASLVYKAPAGRYVYTWPTSATWRNTCREFSLTLSDGTVHSARFDFR